MCSLELTSFLSIDKRGSSETSCQLPLCREGHGETKGYGPQLAGHTLTCGGACGLQLLLGVSRILARLPERRKLFKRAYRTLWLLFCGLVPQLPRWVASARDSYTILFYPQGTPWCYDSAGVTTGGPMSPGAMSSSGMASSEAGSNFQNCDSLSPSCEPTSQTRV